MRLRPYFGIRLPLPRPFYGGFRILRGHRRYYPHTLPNGRRCPVHHTRLDTARTCADRAARLKRARS